MLFKKTGFPEIIFLIFFGLLLGPIFKIIPYENIFSASQYLTALTLIVILFYGGLVLGNADKIVNFLRMNINVNELVWVETFLRRFHSEVSFLMRSFFFVFIGLIYSVNELSLLTIIFYSLIMIAINLFTRLISVFIATAKSDMSHDRRAMTLLCGQRLAHVTLSVIPFQYGLRNASLYTSIVTTIIFTNIISSILILLSKKNKS